MRDESLRSKQAKMEEEMEKAKHLVEELKRALVDKKKQVQFDFKKLSTQEKLLVVD